MPDAGAGRKGLGASPRPLRDGSRSAAAQCLRLRIAGPAAMPIRARCLAVHSPTAAALFRLPK